MRALTLLLTYLSGGAALMCNHNWGFEECTSYQSCCAAGATTLGCKTDSPYDTADVFLNAPQCNYDGCANNYMIYGHDWNRGQPRLWTGSCYQSVCVYYNPVFLYILPCPAKPAACAAGSYATQGSGCQPCTANHFCLGGSYLPTPCTECGSEGLAVTACSATQDAVCRYCDCSSTSWDNANMATWTCASDPSWTLRQRTTHTWFNSPAYMNGLLGMFGRTTPYTCHCDPGHRQTSNFVCEACPVGTGTSGWSETTCEACEPGLFADTAGSYCESCPEGYYCASVTAAPVACGLGFYCPFRSTARIACPAAKYCPTATLAAPIVCPAGSRCPSAQSSAPILCSAGTYCAAGVTSATTCSAGWYCLAGSSVQTPCPAGFYCASTTVAPVACSSGMYCPQYSTSQVPCTAGYYCVPGTDIETQCPAGSRCPQQSATPILCSAGFYCYAGWSTQAACTAGYSCLAGSTSRTPCPAGYVCASTSLPPVQCAAGYYCEALSTVQTPCTAGNVCLAGSSAQTPCPAGKLCTTSTMTACPAGSYCVLGGTTPSPCTSGNVCLEGSSAQTPCPAGKLCTTSTITACPAGSYCVFGGTTPSPCTSGNVCLEGSSAQTPCPAGFRCPTPSQSFPCEAGFMCPARSTTQIKCNEPNTYCAAGCSASVPCPAGSYCMTQASMEACPAGFSCADGQYNECIEGSYCALGSAVELDCPAGWYCEFTDSKTRCPLGSKCPARSTAHVPCASGFYCLEGSVTDTPCPEGFTCPNTYTKIPCPAASYCPTGSISGIPCPPGSSCLAGSKLPLYCPSSTYCPNAFSVPIFCTGDQVCNGNASTPKPCSGNCSRFNVSCTPGSFPEYDVTFALSNWKSDSLQNDYDKVKLINLQTGSVDVFRTPGDIFTNQNADLVVSWNGYNFRAGVPIVMSPDHAIMYAFLFVRRPPTFADDISSEVWSINMTSMMPTFVYRFKWLNNAMRVSAASDIQDDTMLLTTIQGILSFNIKTKTETLLVDSFETYKNALSIERSKDYSYIHVVVDTTTYILDGKTCAHLTQSGPPGSDVVKVFAVRSDFRKNSMYVSAQNYFSSTNEIWVTDFGRGIGTRLVSFGDFRVTMISINAEIKNELFLLGDDSSGLSCLRRFSLLTNTVTFSKTLPNRYNAFSHPIARRCSSCGIVAENIEFTDECAYKCKANFLRINNACQPCTVRNCTFGTYMMPCTETVDTSCASCPPLANKLAWTDSLCNFTCKAGLYRSGYLCSTCTTPACGSGTYRTTCGGTSDSYCAACTAPTGPFNFTSGCNFTCAANTYKANQSCRACSTQPCGPGTWRAACLPEADSTCLACAPPGAADSYIWTSGCNFTCKAGYYYNSTTCALCTTEPCPQDLYRTECRATEDSTCAPCATDCSDGQYYDNCLCNDCPAVDGHFSRGPRCNFSCADDSFVAGPTSCGLCSSMACPAGTFMVPCSATADSRCADCSAPSWAIEWISGCEYANATEVPSTALPTTEVPSTALPSMPTTTTIRNTTALPIMPNTTVSMPTTTSMPVAPVIMASVTISKPYTEVCANTSIYVNGVCDGLRLSNPNDTFACLADALNGVDCPDGVCTCALRSRRLLQDSCNLTTRVTHTMHAIPLVTHMPPWVVEIMVVTIPAAEFPLMALILLVVVLLVAAAVIVILCRPAPRVIPRVNTFENLKFA